MLPDSIHVLSNNQPSYGKLHVLIRLAHRHAINNQLKEASMFLTEYMMFRVETKFLRSSLQAKTVVNSWMFWLSVTRIAQRKKPNV